MADESFDTERDISQTTDHVQRLVDQSMRQQRWMRLVAFVAVGMVLVAAVVTTGFSISTSDYLAKKVDNLDHLRSEQQTVLETQSVELQQESDRIALLENTLRVNGIPVPVSPPIAPPATSSPAVHGGTTTTKPATATTRVTPSTTAPSSPTASTPPRSTTTTTTSSPSAPPSTLLPCVVPALC